MKITLLAFLPITLFATSARVVQAQDNFTILHKFAGDDFEFPLGGLATNGSKIFGVTSTTQPYSSGHAGTIFSMNLDGSGFQLLHAFPYSFSVIEQDASYPTSPPIVVGSKIYGTSRVVADSLFNGGNIESNIIYSMNLDGSGFQSVSSVNILVASGPSGNLLAVGTTLYGTTGLGGPNAESSVYSVNRDGTGYNVLHSFYGSTGIIPNEGLTVADSKIYGTTLSTIGGSPGTVFSSNTDGSEFQTLHVFSASPEDSDGWKPNGNLAVVGSTLYGTTISSGINGLGTIYSMNLDGTGYKILHSFSNSDGWAPNGGLTAVGSKLYGTAGVIDSGSIFSMNLDGSGFQTITTFNPSDVGFDFSLEGGLTAVGSTLYGSLTSFIGSKNDGAIFSITVPESNPLQQCGILMAAWAGAMLFRYFLHFKPRSKTV